MVCQLESIRKCIRLDGLRKTLASLPKTLNETYARILLSIEEDHRRDAHRALQWLCFSARPLRLAEMVEVLAINLNEEPGFAPEQRLPDPRDIITICSSLVSIVSSTTEESGHGQVVPEVRLAHFSVKEYLLSDQLPAAVVSYFKFHAAPAHTTIAQACLLYTLHICSKAPLTQTVLDDHPLARYAAEQWLFHMTAADDISTSGRSNKLALELLASKPEVLSAWLQLFDPDAPWVKMSLKRESKNVASSLYYSSLTGLAEVARILLETGADANSQGGRYGNALQAASRGGHDKIVELLLNNGADVNAQGGNYGNALQAASDVGHEKIVELLLSKGANVNAQVVYWHEMPVPSVLTVRRFGNALQAASSKATRR